MTTRVTSPAQLRAAQRRVDAMKLRRAGLTYREISDALGVSESYAYALVAHDLERTRRLSFEQAEQVRDLELSRLDAVLAAHWEKRSDPKSAKILIELGKRRSELLGLDAPARREVSGPGGGPISVDVDRMRTEEVLELLRETSDEDTVA